MVHFTKVNCQHNEGGVWCNCPKVKRCWFGLGARCCSLYPPFTTRTCSYQKKFDEPVPPPGRDIKEGVQPPKPTPDIIRYRESPLQESNRAAAKELGHLYRVVTARNKVYKPYKDGTPVFEILWDGWSRGFKPEQTHAELAIMGYTDITIEDIKSIWSLMAFKMNADLKTDK